MNISVSDAEVTVQGTEERRRRLDEALVDVLTQDRLRPHDAASLAGKLQFYSQAVTGRSHAAALRPLLRRAQLAGAGKDNHDWRLNSQLRQGIGLLRWSLRHAPPKTFPFLQEAHSVLYADAFFNLFEKNWKPADEDIPNWGRTPPETLRNGWGFVVTVICSRLRVRSVLVCSGVFDPPSIYIFLYARYRGTDHPFAGDERRDRQVHHHVRGQRARTPRSDHFTAGEQSRNFRSAQLGRE